MTTEIMNNYTGSQAELRGDTYEQLQYKGQKYFVNFLEQGEQGEAYKLQKEILTEENKPTQKISVAKVNNQKTIDALLQLSVEQNALGVFSEDDLDLDFRCTEDLLEDDYY